MQIPRNCPSLRRLKTTYQAMTSLESTFASECSTGDGSVWYLWLRFDRDDLRRAAEATRV